MRAIDIYVVAEGGNLFVAFDDEFENCGTGRTVESAFANCVRAVYDCYYDSVKNYESLSDDLQERCWQMHFLFDEEFGGFAFTMS